jgi:cytochrome P450
MRYDAPVPHATFRYATEPVTIDGVVVPEGAQVIISLAAANRDPGSLGQPDRARPRPAAPGLRPRHPLLPGRPARRLEEQLGFTTLLRRFPRLSLADSDAELHWDHGDGLVLRGLSRLPVVAGPSLPREPRPGQ